MPERTLLVLDAGESPWGGFLEEFFEDSRVRIVHAAETAVVAEALAKHSPDASFLRPSLLSLPLIQKFKVLRGTRPEARIFALGRPDPAKVRDFAFDEVFEEPPSFPVFQRVLMRAMPMPGSIRLLVIDDQREVAQMVRDFLKDRTAPSFEIDSALDGAEGLRMIVRRRPDVVLLDIKMPVKDGREVYREIQARGWNLPVIIFFDAVCAEEMIEIREAGHPAVLEKGAPHSALAEMPDLIKKMAYFG
ncbi:MAG: response regulator [Candidatus Omnitrophota bacterium]|jgi:CheY-like chemotaxis protein